MEKIISILYSSIYHIDNDIKQVFEKKLGENDAKNYVAQVISDLMVISNTRKCEFKKDAKLIFFIDDITKNYDEAAITIEDKEILRQNDNKRKIAEQLLNAEIKAKKHEKNLKMTITKGSLLQALVETESGYCFILSKIEHEPYIDNEEMKKRYGLPYKKITLKCCTIDMNENFDIVEIKVSDTASSIAKYWREDFLEVNTLINNTDNTKTMYSSVNKVLRRYLKAKSPKDFNFMQQKVNHYIASNPEYKHSEMIDYLMGTFSPDERLDIDKTRMITELKNIPEKYSIDSQFEIDLKSVQKGLKQQVTVSDGIDLSYEGNPDELKKKIKGVMENGFKVLKILGVNQDVYNLFKE